MRNHSLAAGHFAMIGCVLFVFLLGAHTMHVT